MRKASQGGNELAGERAGRAMPGVLDKGRGRERLAGRIPKRGSRCHREDVLKGDKDGEIRVNQRVGKCLI